MFLVLKHYVVPSAHFIRIFEALKRVERVEIELSMNDALFNSVQIHTFQLRVRVRSELYSALALYNRFLTILVSFKTVYI